MNIWKEFEGLLPKTPLMVGTVQSHNSDGTSTVVLLGNSGTLVVRGTSVPLDALAFVRNGVVEGEAPALQGATSDIEI